MKTYFVLPLLVACATLPASALAQAPDQPAEPGAMSAALPKAHTENGLTYVCGGVGAEESAAMKQAAPEYDLMLTFATRQGAYLADVNVTIADSDGQSLLNTTCDGPIMLVDVPSAGNYRITSEVNDHELVRSVQVRDGQSGRIVRLTWPREQIERATAAVR